MQEVIIEKLVHGGQGLSTLPDGRKVFVWGALPGERVHIRIIKNKRSYAEAIVTDVIASSPVRIAPREENYLATSPWQIVSWDVENDYKKRIVQELFTQAHVAIPDFAMIATEPQWRYRNKMEYSFWGDDDGVHLALHRRGSHNKQIVQGSELALPAIDMAANEIVAQLRKRPSLRAGDLKTIIVRCSQDGQTVVSLFVKTQTFEPLTLSEHIKGIRIYHSNPKSPASVPTKLLHEVGDCTLHDTLLGRTFTYDVDSFFQVNLPIFEKALARIKSLGASQSLVDMYAGVGSIGLSVATQEVDLIELDAATAAMARINSAQAQVNAHVIEAPSEKALEHIVPDKITIFDPPRAGLHDAVVARALEVKPPKIMYLSCNPATQARDLTRLQESYELTFFEGYNFFPHTPHIESLAVLQRKG